MPSIWNKEVDNYKVEIFQSPSLNYERTVRLVLKASETSPAHTVSIRFVWNMPVDSVNIGSGFSTVYMRRDQFDNVYHMLQTEKPLFFTAYEYDTIWFVGLSTDEEATGEGFRDPQA